MARLPWWRCTPTSTAASEAVKFCYQLSYLLDVFDCHSPVLHLLGQRLVRLSGPELVRMSGCLHTLACKPACPHVLSIRPSPAS